MRRKNLLPTTFLFFFSVTCLRAQSLPAEICVVEKKPDSGAFKLAAELSRREFLDGVQRTAVAVTAKNASVESEREQCDDAASRQHNESLVLNAAEKELMASGIIKCESCLLFFTTSGTFNQSPAMHVCVIQKEPAEGALDLGAELSKLRSKDGALIMPISITEKNDKVVSVETERLQCDYAVRIWHHDSADDFANPPPGIPSSMGPPVGVPTQDRATVDYELRRIGSARVISRGSAPPPTIHSRWGKGRQFDPYQLFGTQIVAKINKSLSAN